jgi:hypothetical protein
MKLSSDRIKWLKYVLDSGKCWEKNEPEGYWKTMQFPSVVALRNMKIAPNWLLLTSNLNQKEDISVKLVAWWFLKFF